MTDASPSQLLIYGAIFVGVLLLVAFRVRRMTQSRPLKVDRLWVIPAILGVGALSSILKASFTAPEWALMLLALILGVAIGWLRAKTIRIAPDPVNGGVTAQASFVAIIFLFAVLLLRMGLRAFLAANSASARLSAGAVDAAFLVFAAGLFGARALELSIRAKAVLRAA